MFKKIILSFFLFLFLYQGAFASVTLNFADKYLGIILSDGNLIATHSDNFGSYESVRSTEGKSSGQWYWEVVITGGIMGISNEAFLINNSTSQYVGITSNGWGYFSSDGSKVHNDSFAGYAATYSGGDVIGFALDMDVGTLTTYKNGVSQGVMFTSLSGTMYPTVSLNGGSSSSAIFNFGATPFSFPLPVGFFPYDYLPPLIVSPSSPTLTGSLSSTGATEVFLTGTGLFLLSSIDSNISSINNSLKFQNDFLIIVLGFFIFIFSIYSFFNFYQFLKKNYFFNK